MDQARESWWPRGAGGEPAGRVTTVEVFFDVVFVFTLTQLSRVLEADLSLASAGRVLLLFGILWWMFDGYVWLANHVPPRQAVQKILLFVAMAGFLIAAVGIPHAFGNTGIAFALGYVIVICVHLLLFTQAGIGRVLGLLAAYNLTSAALVLAGGLVTGSARYVLWIAALAMQMVIPYLVPRLSWMSLIGSFRITPAHFVERHGLLVIIALGESVVAIGMGIGIGHVSAGTIAVIALALALPAALWWTTSPTRPPSRPRWAATRPGRGSGWPCVPGWRTSRSCSASWSPPPGSTARSPTPAISPPGPRPSRWPAGSWCTWPGSS
ncbi:MAG TPA: low temperature requirement protein A [Streptosporangiaceae bacterium]|jgi:low temperature requirement protein LtrA